MPADSNSQTSVTLLERVTRGAADPGAGMNSPVTTVPGFTSGAAAGVCKKRMPKTWPNWSLPSS